jgi:penicillin amidase
MARKILVGVLLLVFAVAIAALGFVYYLEHRAVPDYDSWIRLKGLKDEVVVYRDQYAVPHIYARNETDLYRAVGYCMAQDRLFQMDLLRRLTSGRLSEIVGEKTVSVDHLMRALRITEKSRDLCRNADKTTIQVAEAFCDGINQYVESHNRSLPPEFTILGYKPEKWRPEHAFNTIGYFSFDLSTGWNTEIFYYNVLKKVGETRLKEILPDISAQNKVIFPPTGRELSELDLRDSLSSAAKLIDQMGMTIFHGSNNWAVSKDKSATGKPIFANDMHLGLNAPGIWYQMHQIIEGELDVTGVAAPGQPFIIAGHNDRIAWGYTNVMLDDMDFYLEKINPDNPDEYEFNGQWRKMKVTTEAIKLKDGRAVEKVIRYTHRGPVISEIKDVKDKIISMRWIGNEESNEVRALYLLNRAGDWNEFKNAMKTFRSVSQNTLYADKEGNIGLYCAAGIPIREKGNGISIMPGWTDEYDWKGLVPFEKQPHCFNPDDKFLCSANNKTIGNDYPYYVSTWFAPDYRYRRIKEMLREKEKITIDDIRQMQADFKSKLVEDVRADLVTGLETGNLTSIERECLGILKRWDGILSKESVDATIFESFYIEFVRNLFQDELGEDLLEQYMSMNSIVNHAVDQLWSNRSSEWYDDVTTVDKRESFEDIIEKSFKGAVSWLSEKYGQNPSKWQWGELHQLTLEHPLGSVKILNRIFDFNRGPYPVGGSYHTTCPYYYKLSEPFKVVHGASQRHIYSLNNWDESLSVIPTGTSGIPASKHYCNQTPLYVDNAYHPDYFSRTLVEKKAMYVTRFNQWD